MKRRSFPETVRCVPPAPEVMAMLYMEYLRARKTQKVSFRKYLESVGFTNPAHGVVGMDDGALFRAGPAGPELIQIPAQRVTGRLEVKVLLIDFPDRVGSVPRQHYEDLLFSNKTYPTGSMRDYYNEVSLGKVEITGSVEGWLRMPEPYSFYTNNQSGVNWNAYPRNAPRMAEDAVRKALQEGLSFAPELDKLNQGLVTALFIIHAGRGAEVMPPPVRGAEIWSHKWRLRNAINVGPGLAVSTYLTVPEDCKLGVCAHELGHLAFQWQDFYDPNYAEDGKEWDGSGVWDVMAGGSYNGDGSTPAHPAGLHKLQHGWILSRTLTSSRRVALKPYSPTFGEVIKVVSPHYRPKQYLILENRVRKGFDFDLPGEGLLVWRVDESGEMEAAEAPGLLLVQADGRHDLEKPQDWNQGDAGDPFPGTSRRTRLGDSGTISTSFPGGPRARVTLSNIGRDPRSGIIRLDVNFR